MRPAIFLDNSDWKIISSQLRPERIVMTNCRDSAKQVSYAAPPYTHIFRNGPMLCDEIWEFLMYIFSPIDVIAIRRGGQPWKERELQVIVRVD
jgi:hypothetical protein